MTRDIIHLAVPDFPIVVEELLDPKIKERPVAIGIQNEPRSFIHYTSAEARQSGVHRGMPLYVAQKRCRDLTILPPNIDLYMRATSELSKIFDEYSPITEPRRYGHGYLDVSGSQKLLGAATDAAYKAQKDISKRMNMHACAGVAINKLVSKIASSKMMHSGQFNEICTVAPGDEQDFLAPLQTGYLPGVNRQVHQQLDELNIKLIKDLSEVPPEYLQILFGHKGKRLHLQALGIDNSPVQPPKRAPEIIKIEKLPQDSNDYDILRAYVFHMLSSATARLRNVRLVCSVLHLKILYSDFKESSAQLKVPPTNLEQDLWDKADELLHEALTRRIRVQRIELRLRGLSSQSPQLSLFDAPPKIDASKKSVASAVDSIRERFGDKAIFFGRSGAANWRDVE